MVADKPNLAQVIYRVRWKTGYLFDGSTVMLC